MRYPVWAAAALALAGCSPRAPGPAPSPTPPAPPAVVTLGYKSYEARYETHDDSVAALIQAGRPHLDVPANAHVLRTATTHLRTHGVGQVTVTFEQVGLKSGADVVTAAPAGVDLQAPVEVVLGEHGGVASLKWPAPWTEAGMPMAAYDLPLTLLLPPLLPGAVKVDMRWTQQRSLSDTFLDRPLVWALQEAWQVVTVQGPAVTVRYTASGRAPEGQRQTAGEVLFDTAAGRVTDSHATEQTHLQMRWGLHLTLNYRTTRTVTHHLIDR